MTSARELSSRLAGLLAREHGAMADFLLALADFERQRRWVELGHASLFNYLLHELGLSKGAAFYRMTAARVILQHPAVVEPLRDGRLCLTSIVELSKVLTVENAGEVLPRFFQLSKREAKAITAELRPAAVPQRSVVTAVRASAAAFAVPLAPQPAAAASDAPTNGSPDAGQSVHPANLAADALRVANPQRVGAITEEPKTADLSRIHVTVSRRFLQKLAAARDALSHSHPGASDDELLEAGLDLLLDRHAKRKGLVAKPRRDPPPSKPDHIPAHVSRAVWTRDGGKCQWPVEGGGVCSSTHRVQLDHIVPRARGGPSTVDNLRCLCAVHNDFAARRIYGDAFMDRYSRGRRAEASGVAPAPPR